MKKLVLFGILHCLVLSLTAQKTKTYQLLSPDKKNKITIVSAGTIIWSVQHDNVTVLAPSSLALEQH